MSAVGALKATQTLMGITHILFQGRDNIVPVRASWYFHHGGKKRPLTYLQRVTLLGRLVTAIVAVIAAAYVLSNRRDLFFGLTRG